MSARRERSRLLWVAALSTVALVVAATAAWGFVQIYGNNFNTRQNYRAVKSLSSGNKCTRDHRQKAEVMYIKLKGGPDICRYKPPVQGSGHSPDHRFDVAGKILPETKGKLRRDAFLWIAVRVGGNKHYELRVFPRASHFALRRVPNGTGFPANGDDPGIKGIGKMNKMRLIVEGSRVRAVINGTEVADVTDANADAIRGAKVEFGVGSRRKSKRITSGVVDRLKLAVPTP